jgi:nucleotidyltransferase/DNA polymerase involved in DNA repair
MDAFFASVEQLDRPELRGKPVVVGGDPFKGRNVVSSASYEARAYGIHAAMPTRHAYRLCPRATFLKGRFARYEQFSRRIFKIMLKFSPAVEPASIDEAFVDLTGTEKLFGDPIETAKKIKEEIKVNVNLPVSVGVAPNKLLAKIASEEMKPDGFFVIKENEIRSFLDPKPLSIIPGIGPKLSEQLAGLGFVLIRDVLKYSLKEFVKTLGGSGREIYQLVQGIDDRPVKPPEERKQISQERTFDSDISDFGLLKWKLLLLCDRIAERLLKRQIVGRTITLKVKFSDMKSITRSETIDFPTRSNKLIYDIAEKLLINVQRRNIRLLGISISNLVPSVDWSSQLFSVDSKSEDLVKLMLDIREKHGYDRIVRAFEITKKRR